MSANTHILAPDDQAAALRARRAAPAAAEPRARRLRCLAVGSGKGGVGKTMVSVGLSYMLAQRGHRVLLMDADLGLANVDLQIGVDPHFTLQDVIFGKCALAEAVLTLDEGPDLLAAASGSPELVDMGSARRQLFVEELVRFAGRYDFLIIDVGAGIGDNVTAFLAAVPEVLVVVANEPTSIMDAYALVKTLAQQPDPPIMLAVVNMARSLAEGEQLAHRLNAIVQKYVRRELPLAGIIPYDPAVGNAIRARRPVVRYAPTSAPTCALESLAEFVASGRSYLRAGICDQQPLFDRLMNLGREPRTTGGAAP